MEEFQKYFSSPLLTIIFDKKIVILDRDSILRVKMMVVSQPYAMLIDKSLHLSHHMSGLRSPLKFDKFSKSYLESYWSSTPQIRN